MCFPCQGLGQDIQTGSHSPVLDALGSLRLLKAHRANGGPPPARIELVAWTGHATLPPPSTPPLPYALLPSDDNLFNPERHLPTPGQRQTAALPCALLPSDDDLCTPERHLPTPGHCGPSPLPCALLPSDDDLFTPERHLPTPGQCGPSDSPCECEHNDPDSLDARLFPSVVLAVAPAVTMDEASSLSGPSPQRHTAVPTTTDTGNTVPQRADPTQTVYAHPRRWATTATRKTVPQRHGDTTRGDGRHTDHRSNATQTVYAHPRRLASDSTPGALQISLPWERAHVAALLRWFRSPAGASAGNTTVTPLYIYMQDIDM